MPCRPTLRSVPMAILVFQMPYRMVGGLANESVALALPPADFSPPRCRRSRPLNIWSCRKIQSKTFTPR